MAQNHDGPAVRETQDSCVTIINQRWACQHEAYIDREGNLLDPRMSNTSNTITIQSLEWCSWCLCPSLSQAGLVTRVLPYPQNTGSIYSNSTSYGLIPSAQYHNNNFTNLAQNVVDSTQATKQPAQPIQVQNIAEAHSVSTANAPPPNAPIGPKISVDGRMPKHRQNKPCPINHPFCHWHYSTEACHKQWQHCDLALPAIKASYRAKNEWKGAPKGWNEEHAPCLTDQGPTCELHQKIRGETEGKGAYMAIQTIPC